MSNNNKVPVPTWTEILSEPFVTLILGKRGGGKTATGHRLLEIFGENNDDRDAYIMGYPDDEAEALPEWIDTLPATVGLENWPEDSIVLVHEAHHIAHARESQEAENLSIDKLVTVSRHRNSDIVFETQQSQRLDRNFPAAVDGIVFKQPALMQEEFERRQMKQIVGEANEVFDQYRTVHETDNYEWVEEDDDIQKHAYVYSDTFRGEYPHDIQLAEHWTENISKAYGENDILDTAEGEGGGDSLSDTQIAALESVAKWEHDNRPLKFDHQGAQYSDTSAHPSQLAQLEQNGYMEKVYESSNKANRYRLTDDGWHVIQMDKPDEPLLAEEA